MQPKAFEHRPTNLEDFIGQQRLVGAKGPIRKFIESGKIPSLIFWGPPGTGKTTLAIIIAKSIDADFYTLSAVSSGKEQLKEIIKIAKSNSADGNLFERKQLILFLDEIHRWNKAQQDALLPYIESGLITLIGATTENPSFHLIPALLSRSRVFTLDKHSKVDVEKFFEILIKKDKDLSKLIFKEGVLALLAEFADGDLRNASNILESISITLKNNKDKNVSKEILGNLIENFLQYDNGEDHYNLISAVHKCLRDGDADAGVYWVCRMIAGGDDPLYIARRLLRFASEDIGNAVPTAVVLANTVFETCQKLGRPECDVALVQLTIYLARAKKSNEAYMAYNKAMEDIYKFGCLPVPMNIRNAPTKLMKELGYGKGYVYSHDDPEGASKQEHLPKELKGRKYTSKQ